MNDVYDEVIIVCFTFNHVKYVRKTLEGFVTQKTTFPFRIVVHDDASTDGTQEILKEYQSNYPNLFTMILQSENQYSKDPDLVSKIVSPYVNGKYFAFCEGDDYWCDCNKLQQQYDYMEAHNSCSMCVHDTVKIDVNDNVLSRINGLNNDCDYYMSDIIKDSLRGLFQTSSFFARWEVYKVPPEIDIEGIGDFPMAINACLNGYIHYIGKVMSCYRVGGTNTWSTRSANREFLVKRFKISYEAMNRINKYTNYKYNTAFEYRIGETLFKLYRFEYGFGSILLNFHDMKLIVKWLVTRICREVRSCFFKNGKQKRNI